MLLGLAEPLRPLRVPHVPLAAVAVLQLDRPHDDATGQVVAGHVRDAVFRHHLGLFGSRIAAQAGVDVDLASDFRWASPVLDLLHAPHDRFGVRLSDAQCSHGQVSPHPLGTFSTLPAMHDCTTPGHDFGHRPARPRPSQHQMRPAVVRDNLDVLPDVPSDFAAAVGFLTFLLSPVWSNLSRSFDICACAGFSLIQQYDVNGITEANSLWECICRCDAFWVRRAVGLRQDLWAERRKPCSWSFGQRPRSMIIRESPCSSTWEMWCTWRDACGYRLCPARVPTLDVGRTGQVFGRSCQGGAPGRLHS